MSCYKLFVHNTWLQSLGYHFKSNKSLFVQHLTKSVHNIPTTMCTVHTETNGIKPAKCVADRIRSLTDDQSEFNTLIEECSNSLKMGHVISVPTDTIYGITCVAQSTSGIEQLYNIKQRNPHKPIAICVADVKDIQKWGQVQIPQGLLDALLPGPVTVIFKRTAELNKELNAETPLVGIRVPDDRFIRDLCRACGQPLALTSANLSNVSSSLNINEFKDLWDKLDLIVDGGQLGQTDESRLGSTVVDLSLKGVYKIIRSGSAQRDTVKKLEKFGLENVDNAV